MSATPEHQVVDTQRAASAVFVNTAGSKYIKSKSISSRNPAGNLQREIPAGTVLDRRTLDGLSYPLKLDSAQSAVSSGNTIEVGNVNQWTVGDLVELPDSVAVGADRFRSITNVDKENDEITVDGSTFNLTSGDVVRCIPSRPRDSVQNSGTTTGSTISVNDASKFSVGDKVDVGPATATIHVELPDGTYTGSVGLTLTVFDEEGNELVDVDAVVDADNETDDTIMTSIANAIDDQLSNAPAGNLGSATVSTGAPSTVDVTIADPDHEFEWSFTDSDITASLTASEDDSTSVEITAVDKNNDEIDLARSLTFNNGEAVVGDPTGDYTICVETVRLHGAWDDVPQNIMVATRKRGEAMEPNLYGLVEEAKAAMQPVVEFTPVST